MTVETHTEVQRDRWNRPLIVPAGGGKPVAYTRCTSFVDVLEDKYNLQKWMQRMVAVGIGTRPDLHLSASALAADPDSNKRGLDDLCESAIEAAKGSAKATIGTALHAYIERINLGQEPGPIPAEYQQHINNYTTAVRGVLTPVHVERFTVQDELQIGGTPDLVAEIAGESGRFIVDLKTGPSTLKYGALKVAMQLAVYAHSELYDPGNGQRTPIDGIRHDKGLVIALDSETAACTLHWVDIAAGWEAVQVAAEVRQWRKRKTLLTDYAPPAPPQNTTNHSAHAALLNAIAETPTRDALIDLWGKAGPAWTDTHTQAAQARLQAIA